MGGAMGGVMGGVMGGALDARSWGRPCPAQGQKRPQHRKVMLQPPGR